MNKTELSKYGITLSYNHDGKFFTLDVEDSPHLKPTILTYEQVETIGHLFESLIEELRTDIASETDNTDLIEKRLENKFI